MGKEGRERKKKRKGRAAGRSGKWGYGSRRGKLSRADCNNSLRIIHKIFMYLNIIIK